MIDASALLWRIQLQGREPGHRWVELANAWAPHIDDAFCSFNDVHAMLAFVGGRHWGLARRLENTLMEEQASLTRHGETTRLVGLPACRALLAFGQGDNGLAIEQFERLPPRAYRLGGSHAQRDVLYLTLQAASRPVSPWRPRRSAPQSTTQLLLAH